MTVVRPILIIGLLLALEASIAVADDPSSTTEVMLANVETPAENTPDEPRAATFSAEQAERFLDASSLTWQKQRECMTCHTNYLYLLARPGLGAKDEAHRAVRQFAEELVTKRWPEHGPRWDAEVVMTAMVLAYNDRLTTGQLHPTTQTALDRMWTVQSENGGVKWIHCGWPPFELNDEFGATMMALAVSVAPEAYADTPAAQAGSEKLKQYLAATKIASLHHRAMLLWADTHRPGWLSATEREAVLNEILALQHDDGSWSIAALGDWKRKDGSPQDVTTGDGYATGLAIVLARASGIAAEDARLQNGISWLKANQRESGRWFTRSLYQDNKHYISHAGSSMAVMALTACDSID